MIVVVVFLQTWRASIIPLVAVPVSLVGTFAVMLGLGFSLNTLSLFGLVLAIGIVVDDAIVVVENVERHIELGLPPMEATQTAMEEVSGPIIAIALVLGAVFVPTAFISGLTGQFYRQFALTIAISTVHLGVQLADAEPGAGVAAAARRTARRATGSARHRSACSAGSSAASTARSRAGRRSTPAASSRVLRVVGRRAGALRRPARRSPVSVSRRCRRASSRRRTRTTSSRSRSCPTARRWIAPNG